MIDARQSIGTIFHRYAQPNIPWATAICKIFGQSFGPLDENLVRVLRGLFDHREHLVQESIREG